MSDGKTIARLNRFLEIVKEMGFEVRQELLDGKGAAICHIHGRPCLFVDVSSGPAVQLEAIQHVLSSSN